MRNTTLLSTMLSLTLVLPTMGQSVIRITSGNRTAIHSQLGIRQPNASDASRDHRDRHECEHDRDCVQIGTFTTIMWLNGQAMYEFDWANCDGIVGECSDSNA